MLDNNFKAVADMLRELADRVEMAKDGEYEFDLSNNTKHEIFLAAKKYPSRISMELYDSAKDFTDAKGFKSLEGAWNNGYETVYISDTVKLHVDIEAPKIPFKEGE